MLHKWILDGIILTDTNTGAILSTELQEIVNEHNRQVDFERKVLTTGQISTLCSVAPRTVSKWIDTGLLKGHRIPGSKDRRVLYSDLKAFMIKHEVPNFVENF